MSELNVSWLRHTVFLQSKVSVSYTLERTQPFDTHAQIYVLLCTKSLPLSPASLSLLPLPSASLSSSYLVLPASATSLPYLSPLPLSPLLTSLPLSPTSPFCLSLHLLTSFFRRPCFPLLFHPQFMPEVKLRGCYVIQHFCHSTRTVASNTQRGEVEKRRSGALWCSGEAVQQHSRRCSSAIGVAVAQRNRRRSVIGNRRRSNEAD